MDLETFSIAAEIEREANRRLRMLGDLIHADIDSDEISGLVSWRTHQTGIPKKIIYEWLLAFKNNGVEGLKPFDWIKLWNSWKEKQKLDVINRYNAISTPIPYLGGLINLAETEIIPEDDE